MERAAFFIHACIHRARPHKAAVVLHTHMPWTTALTCLKDPRCLSLAEQGSAAMSYLCSETRGARLLHLLACLPGSALVPVLSDN